MAAERCPETQDGVQCILEAGHSAQHRTGWDEPAVQAPAAAPSPAMPKKPGRSISQRQLVVGLVVLAIGLVAFGMIRDWTDSTSGGNGGGNPARNVTGAFVGWDPDDDVHGYVVFTITNHGSQTETARCSVRVSNDFGNFGFDSLVGETVGPGQTINGRMAISVGEGSALINKGEVSDC